MTWWKWRSGKSAPTNGRLIIIKSDIGGEHLNIVLWSELHGGFVPDEPYARQCNVAYSAEDVIMWAPLPEMPGPWIKVTE